MSHSRILRGCVRYLKKVTRDVFILKALARALTARPIGRGAVASRSYSHLADQQQGRRGHEMNYLENILANVFSADVGLAESGISAALEVIRLNPDRRELEGIIRNFEELLAQNNVGWRGLLDNEAYEVAILESEEEAKAFILENLMKPLGWPI